MKRSYKSAIFLCLVLAIFAIAGFFVVKKYLLPNETITEQEDDDDIEEQQKVVEFLVSSSVSCEINTTAQISYLVNYCENYIITFSINDITIAEIDNTGTITPKMVGTAQITTSLSYDGKQITRTSNLTVYSNTNTCELNILSNSQKVTNLMKNDEYIVKISRDCFYKTIGNLEISFQDYFNLSNSGENFLLQKLSDDYKEVLYKFIPYKSGKYSFSFVDDYFNRNLTKTCYSQTEEILTQTNYAKKISENNYKIYLFDTTYISQANSDGYYNYATVVMLQNVDSNEVLSFELKVKNNLEVSEYLNYSVNSKTLTINPKNPCNFSLIISSSKTNFTKTINFTVENIYTDKILFNSEECLISNLTEKTFEVEKDSDNNFVLSKSINYSVGEIIVETESSDVVISNGKIKITKYGTYEVFVKYNNSVVLKLTYKVLNDYYFKIDEIASVEVMPGDTYAFVKHTNTEIELNVRFLTDFKVINLTYVITNSNSVDAQLQTSKFCDLSFDEQRLPENWEHDGNRLYMDFSECEISEFILVSNFDENVYLKIKINII